MNISIAIFAKTPGFTPAKTRVAQERGDETAALLHSRLVERSLRLAWQAQQAGFRVIFAIAEQAEAAQRWWQERGVVAQFTGVGTLGERMQRVHQSLCQQGGVGVLLGTDAPAVSVAVLNTVKVALCSQPAVIGPAHDGGMYLFASRHTLQPACWRRPAWGTDQARAGFLRQIRHYHGWEVASLPALPDLDRVGDWPAVQASLEPHDIDVAPLRELLNPSRSKRAGVQ